MTRREIEIFICAVTWPFSIGSTYPPESYFWCARPVTRSTQSSSTHGYLSVNTAVKLSADERSHYQPRQPGVET